MNGLSEALAAWRETRARVIADAIDGLTPGALASWQAPAPRTNQAFHGAWLAAAADDAQRGWAITTLLDKLPGGDSDGKCAALVVRLEALEKAGPDPRVAREVLRLLHVDPPIMGFTVVVDACARVLEAALDERLRAQLEELAPIANDFLAKRIASLLAATADARRPTTAELARYAALAPAPAPKAADTSALFSEVYAHPDSDDARIVLADVLQAQGDPRGELIALQLLGDGADPERIARAEELLKKHGKDWLGDLRKVTYRCRFQRGFLARLELAGKWNATKAGWEEHAADPMLGTVEDLLTGRATSEVYKQFVSSPAMVGLKRIDVWDKHSLEALAQTEARLEHVSCGYFKRGNYQQVFSQQVLPACERIATLVSMAMDTAVFEALRKSKLFGRLQRYVFGNWTRCSTTTSSRAMPRSRSGAARASRNASRCARSGSVRSGSRARTRSSSAGSGESG